MKRCTRCKKDLPKSDFYKDSRGQGGLRSWCKFCHQEVSSEYQRLDKDGAHRRGVAYRNRHPFRIDIQRAERRARKFGVVSTLTEDEWKDRVKECNFKCHICGESLTLEVKQTNTLSLDHEIPLNRGGSNVKENAYPACWNCNRSKGDRTRGEFQAWVTKVFNEFQNSGLGNQAS